jgi:hypothetical protein
VRGGGGGGGGGNGTPASRQARSAPRPSYSPCTNPLGPACAEREVGRVYVGRVTSSAACVRNVRARRACATCVRARRVCVRDVYMRACAARVARVARHVITAWLDTHLVSKSASDCLAASSSASSFLLTEPPPLALRVSSFFTTVAWTLLARWANRSVPIASSQFCFSERNVTTKAAFVFPASDDCSRRVSCTEGHRTPPNTTEHHRTPPNTTEHHRTPRKKSR